MGAHQLFILLRDELFAWFYENPGYDSNNTEQGRCRKGIVPAVVGDEKSRNDRSQNTANIAPEVNPAGNGTGVFTA